MNANYHNFEAIYVNPETLNDLHYDIQFTTAPQGSTIRGGLILLANVESTQLNSIMVTYVFHNSNSNKSKNGRIG
jgi:hypothetical protein